MKLTTLFLFILFIALSTTFIDVYTKWDITILPISHSNTNKEMFVENNMVLRSMINITTGMKNEILKT